jgi:magnesium-transporting ATPase (P-type)
MCKAIKQSYIFKSMLYFDFFLNTPIIITNYVCSNKKASPIFRSLVVFVLSTSFLFNDHLIKYNSSQDIPLSILFKSIFLYLVFILSVVFLIKLIYYVRCYTKKDNI